jgi:hypothetical protein
MDMDSDGLCWVPENGEISMLGPYLVEKVCCPLCGEENTLRLLEGPASPVRGVLTCVHLRYRELRDTGSYYAFAPTAPPATAA